MNKVTLKIVGDHQMNCGGCEGNVRYTLSQVPGVEAVVASNQTQLVELDLNKEVAVDVLKSALMKIGYQAELV